MISEPVVERLLLCKAMIGPFRSAPPVQPDRQTLASHVLASHDAAELALAAIAEQLQAFPNKQQVYLMDFFPELRKKHPERDAAGKQFFGQLNRVRIDIKHHGVFPDAQQWCRVASRTYEYISTWCEEYLGVPLDSLDDAALLRDGKAKELYLQAKDHAMARRYREAIETLSHAEFALFENNAALRGMSVGEQKAEDAIKLSAYGVHANEYLALQEFLPKLTRWSDGSLHLEPDQTTYDHPGNWRDDTADFCLRTFVSIALRIQNAPWVPGPVHFRHVYDHLMTALRDGVEMWTQKDQGFMMPKLRTVERTLNRGDSLRGMVIRPKRGYDEKEDAPPTLLYVNMEAGIVGYVYASDVEVTCVPRETDYVRKYFPDLPVIPAVLDET